MRRLRELLDPLARVLGERRRRTELAEGRAHVEIGPLAPSEVAPFDRALRGGAGEDPRLHAIQVNLATRRVTFSFEPGTVDLAELVERVVHAERAAGLHAPRFEGLPEHPADAEPALRRVLGLAADAVAFGTGLGLRILPIPPAPFSGSIAALLALIESVDRLREPVEERIGPERTELALDVGIAFFSALAQRPLTSLVDALHEVSRLREANAVRATWQGLEPELHDALVDGVVGDHTVEPRPVELPRGPIEEYADRAWVVSLASFAVSFATSRSLQRALAAIFGSLPRPARLGRDVFAAELARMLADRRVLVLAPERLRLLDRIDCLVLAGDLVAARAFELGAVTALSGEDEGELTRLARELFDPASPLEARARGGVRLGPLRLAHGETPAALAATARERAHDGALVLALERGPEVVAVVEVTIRSHTGLDELVAAAHDAGMRVVLAAPDDSVLQQVSADDVIRPEEGVTAGIRRLQREGRGVAFVTAGASPGLAAADLGLGVRRRGAPIPWGAHLFLPDDLTEVRLLLGAAARARQIGKQSVNVALGAAAFGALVSAGGLLPLTSRRVLFVVNAASLVAMANGLRGSIQVRRLALPPTRDPTPWHALDADGVLARLGSERAGLSRDALAGRRVGAAPEPSAPRELVEAITDELFNPLAPLLAAGAGLSAAVGSIADAAMVGGVVGVNAAVGGVQRFVTERKIRLIARSESHRAVVRREGLVESVDAAMLVPGDVVLLVAGDVVPADCRLLEASAVEVDASSLTGESLPVRKFAAPSFEAQPADRSSILYEGTTLVAGEAVAVVVAVGDHTEARRGAAGARGTRGPAGVERRLTELMRLTGPIALGAGIGVVGGGLLRGRKLEELVGSAVSLAVASVPEGLPLLATAAQLAASERLSRRGALVRNVRAVEALGRVDVVCFDKTGTLTDGTLALGLVSDGTREARSDAPLPRGLVPVLAAGLRAVEARAPGARGRDPTDRALAEAAERLLVTERHDAPGWQRRADVAISLGRAYRAVLGRHEGGMRLAVKGAPETLLLACTSRRTESGTSPLDAAGRLELVRAVEALAAAGLRVIAVAERAVAPDAAPDPELVVDLCFLGFLAFRDPLRRSARAAVRGFVEAGVRPVMITGDHPSTARAIAEAAGLPTGGRLLLGAELAALGDEALDAQIDDVTLFARVTPSQKVRIVRALQRRGRVVAMIGDGANDAAAIRLADVGVAFGDASTPAARAAADLVVTGEHLEALLEALAEGRAMWAAVRSAVGLLMGGNLGEIGFTLLAGVIDGSPALHARQLLLVNLFTDIAPAMAIALRPPPPELTLAAGNDSADVALGAPLDREMATRALVTTLGATAAWGIGRLIGSRARARTIGLVAVVGTQLGQTIASGGVSRPVLLTSLASAGMLAALVQTPGVSHFFGCRPLGPISWTAAIGASVAATALGRVIDERLSGRLVDEAHRAAEAPRLALSGLLGPG